MELFFSDLILYTKPGETSGEFVIVFLIIFNSFVLILWSPYVSLEGSVHKSRFNFSFNFILFRAQKASICGDEWNGWVTEVSSEPGLSCVAHKNWLCAYLPSSAFRTECHLVAWGLPRWEYLCHRKKCYKSGIFLFFLESLLLNIYQHIPVRVELSSTPAHNWWPSIQPYALDGYLCTAVAGVAHISQISLAGRKQQQWQWTSLSIAINIQLQDTTWP